MRYQYNAYATNGQIVSGVIEASTKNGAISKLREQGMMVKSMRLAPELKLDLSMELTPSKLNLRQQSLLYSQLAMLVKGGVPILQSLEVLAAQARRPLDKILRKMVADVEVGNTLSKAMSNRHPAFAPMAVQILSVSELSGELDRGLRMLSEQFDAEDALQRKFVSALIYPVTVLVMAFSLAIFMVTFIVPQYAGMFRDLGADLPWQTQALLAVSDFVVSNWWSGPLLVVAVMVFLYIKRRNEKVKGKVDQFLLKIPVFGPLMRMREVARYTRSVGTLMKAGIPVVTAARFSTDLIANTYLAGRLNGVPDAISNGATFGQAVKVTNFLPPIFAELVVVGEMISNADETLEYTAKLAESDVKQTVERLTSIMEPFMILILGGIVFVIIVPLLLPMFDLYSKVQ